MQSVLARRRIRRETPRLLVVLLAALVALVTAVPTANAQVLPVGAGPGITVFSAEQVASQIKDPVVAAQVLAGIVTVPTEELTTLALAVTPRADLPHQVRAAAGSAEHLVFIDYYFDQALSGMYAVATSVRRSTLEATELVVSTLARNADGTLTATAVSDNRRVEMSTRSAASPECTACDGAGIVAGAAFGATVCGPGALVCGIAGGLFGLAGTVLCKDTVGCNNPARPDMAYQYQRCAYTSCAVQVQIQNSGRQLISLGYQVYWAYPGFTCASRSGSACVVNAGENNSFPLIPAADLGKAGQVYAYEFFSATPGWTRCAATAMVSISAYWSDYTLRSTGYVIGPKLFANDCPGYRSTI